MEREVRGKQKALIVINIYTKQLTFCRRIDRFAA